MSREKVLRPAVAAARTKPIGQNSTLGIWQRTKLKSSLTQIEQGLVAGPYPERAGELDWRETTSDQEIQEIVLTTNLIPRKCLGFKTPFQALIAELGKDVQIRFS